MWNERYASDEYFYGTEPNTFLAEHAEGLIPLVRSCPLQGRLCSDSQGPRSPEWATRAGPTSA